MSATPAAGPAPALRIAHLALGLTGLGGVQSILRHHHTTDPRWGFDSRFVVFFEGPAGGDVGWRADRLGLTWRHTVASARRRMRERPGGVPPDVVLYHDLWGLPFFADLDGAGRRLGMIHCPIPRVLRNLAANADLLDGVLCVGQPTVEAVRRVVPAFPPERLTWVPVPVREGGVETRRPPLRGRPFVLGYSGRLEREIKRVDRLPRLWRRLGREDLDLRLEVLGDGPARRWLERRFRGDRRVTLHGVRTGAAYWETLAGWDAIVYVSDAEGLGLSLLEAMSLGALPVYPAIGGGGEPYVRAVRPDLVYPPDDFGHVSRVVRALTAAPEAAVDALRARGREVVAPHRGEAYDRAFSAFVRSVVAAPRRSAGAFRARPVYLTDHWPFALLQRAYRRAFWRNRSRSTGGSAPI